MKKLFGILLLMIFISCKKETYCECEMDYEKITKKEISRLTNIIEKRGNIEVYQYTKFHLEKQSQFKELLPIAKFMSDEYNYQQASYDVYLSYRNISDYELSDLTKKEKEIAISYLINAFINGNKNAKKDLEKYAEKKLFVVKKDSIFKKLN